MTIVTRMPQHSNVLDVGPRLAMEKPHGETN